MNWNRSRNATPIQRLLQNMSFIITSFLYPVAGIDQLDI